MLDVEVVRRNDRTREVGEGSHHHLKLWRRILEARERRSGGWPARAAGRVRQPGGRHWRSGRRESERTAGASFLLSSYLQLVM